MPDPEPASPAPPAEPEPVIELPPVALPEALDLRAFAEPPMQEPEPKSEPEPEPEAEPAPALRDPVALVMPELTPIPPPPAFTLEPMPEPPALSIEEEIRAQLGRAPSSEPAPAPEPVVEAAPVPGLIADADLAALEDSKPPLAPLDTLDVVGAYDSGGTRFTMYSDGSVVAAGPEGETRYPTLQDLRRHLDQLAG